MKQLNLFDVLLDYPNGIVPTILKESGIKKYSNSNKIDASMNALICLVKNDNISKFLDKTATVYYTGKRFPSTIRLDKLCYFVPYITGQGIRDLYMIKIVRVGTKKEGETNASRDYRLVFEIEYIRPLFPDYRPYKLDIWHTYTELKLEELITFD